MIYPQAAIVLFNEKKINSIYFGEYIQKENGEPEPIEWLILSVEGKRALVISKYCLDSQHYNSTGRNVEWKKTTMCKWLNNTFFKKTFNDEEQRHILSSSDVANGNPTHSIAGKNATDKVIILNRKEVETYFETNSARQCQGTEYCYAKGAYNDEYGNCWWVIGPPIERVGCSWAFYVDEGGTISINGLRENNDDYAVRPAIWIDFNG